MFVISHNFRTVAIYGLGFALLGLMLAPVIGLFTQMFGVDILAALVEPSFLPSLWLSLTTSAVALVVIMLGGLPLSWIIARRGWRWVAVLTDLPIVLPPAVLGVALLTTFGRGGALGVLWASMGLSLPFSTAAVILAQIIVGAPFFIAAATAGFRRVDPEMIDVARTLGASKEEAFVRIAVPIALPSVIAGASIAWARALGEFGATLLFAGSLPGRTQTLPLAIYSTLEQDFGVAVVMSAVRVVIGMTTLVLFRMFDKEGRRI